MENEYVSAERRGYMQYYKCSYLLSSFTLLHQSVRQPNLLVIPMIIGWFNVFCGGGGLQGFL